MHLQYILRLADNALIFDQYDVEWTGHGPVLEEDTALSNLSLGLIGQARLLYMHTERIEGALTGTPHMEDSYACWRAESAFRNCALLELSHAGPLVATPAAVCDYAVTIVHRSLYVTLMVSLWEALTRSTDPELAVITARLVKGMRYHPAYTCDQLVRFGDGTDKSYARFQAALDQLMLHTNGFSATDGVEMATAEAGFSMCPADLYDAWKTIVCDALDEATLRWSEPGPYVSTGRHGVYSEYIDYPLAEMQGLARQYPGVSW